MHIGLLKEKKQDERRVALTPSHVQKLMAEDHQVWIEPGAGQAAQYSDQTYEAAGALLADRPKILAQCKLLLKVKCPLPEEYDDYRADHILFTYLHLDENIPRDRITTLIQSGFLGIAYEWVETAGNYPLLEPMSRLTGHLFYQRSVELLAAHKGVLAGSYLPQIPGAQILIIGLGRIGEEVLKCALLNRLNIVVVARDPDQVHIKASHILGPVLGKSQWPKLPLVIPFDNDNPEVCQQQINNIVPNIDILINCAVRRANLPKSKLPYLVTKAMIQQMEPNSIVCDATACDRDLIETCVSSEQLQHYDIIDNVIHYSPDHIPSYVPKTSTDMLSNATFPYIQLLANKGIDAIKTEPALRQGVSCYRGKVTHAYTANKKGFDYTDILDLL